MNILFVHSGSDLYGASRSLLRLSTRLVQDGHTVLAILPSEGPLLAELQKSGVSVRVHHDLPMATRKDFRGFAGKISLLFKVPASVWKLTGVVNEFHADFIHTNTALILSPGIVARLTGIPHVWHVREFFEDFPNLWKWYQWYISLLSTRIICVSAAVAQQFTSSIIKRKITVLHNGFPAGEFARVDGSRVDAFKKKFGLEGYTLIGVVGRIKLVRKGQDTVLRATQLLNGRFSRIRIVFVGSPFPGNEDHLHSLMALADELGVRDKVVYTGDVEDIGASYAALDISLLPSSLPEPFGGVVIESMAYGKPVIGTNIGGTPEQIEHGVTGLLVKPNDPEELKQAIEQLLDDREEALRMGQQGQARFLKFFEFESFYEKIQRVYASLK